MRDLPARFAAELARVAPPAGVGLVAVSGGMDSLVLLHLLIATRDRHGLTLVVAHVDHGIAAVSPAVAGQVEEWVRSLGLPFEIARLGLGAGASETRAREARYRWLFATLDRLGPGVVLTGHHRDDQVETVLMRVLRGSGPAGLRGIAESGPRVARPLLTFSREELWTYGSAHGLPAWVDPANASPAHLRSWLRTELLPALRARLPDVERRLLALREHAALDRAGWDTLLEVLPLAVVVEPGGISIASAPLRAYDTRLAANLVMAAGRRAGLAIGPSHAARVIRALQRGQSGAQVELPAGWVAELRFQRLAFIRQTVESPWVVRLEGAGGAVEVGDWRLQWRTEPPSDGGEVGDLARIAWATRVVPGRYEARNWRPGDRIRPLGGVGSRPVVRCMQEQRIGRSERTGWPVVSHAGIVVWVPGVCRAGCRVPSPGTEAWHLVAERR